VTDTVRWGILGTGRIAAQFADALRLVGGARLEAVASRRVEVARAFAAAHGAPRVHAGLGELAGDPAVDLVYVATPAALHRANALALLEAGKPVLVEKPFATSVAEGREVVTLARARGLFCMEAMWMRFTPAAREIERLVRGGALGEIRLLEASLGWPHAPRPGERVFDAERGGGALLDLGVYAVSLAHWLLGRPSGVVAAAVLEGDVDEQVGAVLTFPGGAQALLAASLRGLLANEASVTGTAGRLRIHEPFLRPEVLTLTPAPAGRQSPGRGRLSALTRHPLLRPVRALRTRLGRRQLRRPVLGEGYAHEAIEAMRALRAGERESPIMPLDETLSVLETLDAVRAAFHGPRSISGGN
jgi:predicted dehydrogenase